jgi:hypothetical protein
MATNKKAADSVAANETEQTDVSVNGKETAGNGGNPEATEAKEDVTYTAEEFAKASETVFDKPYSQDIVSAAFRMAGKSSATKKEAAKIVGKFLNKEVKVK